MIGAGMKIIMHGELMCTYTMQDKLAQHQGLKVTIEKVVGTMCIKDKVYRLDRRADVEQIFKSR